MTVSIADNKITYVGDGIQTSFPYPFRVLDASHMQVTVDGVGNTDWSITQIGEDGGGDVVFNTAPANGTEILLYRAVPIDQLIDYVAYDPFPAETHELGLDKLTMIAQQIQEQLNRAVLVPPDEDNGFIIDLEDRAPFKVLHFDDTGTTIRADYEIGNYQGDWLTATSYRARVTLIDPATGDVLLVIKDHVSDTVANDLAAGNLVQLMDLSTLVAERNAAEIARDEAEAARDAAQLSETNAAVSASNAADSEVASKTSEDNARAWAIQPEDVPVDDGVNQGFSSYHYALKAYQILQLGGNISVSVEVTDVTGNFINDLNAHDFSGNQFADGVPSTALNIIVNRSLNITYAGNLYIYQGVRPTLIGLGGDVKTADEFDLIAVNAAGGVSYDNSQGFPTENTVQGAIDQLGQLITIMHGWDVQALIGPITLADYVGPPRMHRVTNNPTVTLPADGAVPDGTVYSFFTTAGSTLTFDEATNGQTIFPPEGKAKTYAEGVARVCTLMYIGASGNGVNEWLMYGDLADA